MDHSVVLLRTHHRAQGRNSEISWVIAVVILVKYDGGQITVLALGVVGSGQILDVF